LKSRTKYYTLFCVCIIILLQYNAFPQELNNNNSIILHNNVLYNSHLNYILFNYLNSLLLFQNPLEINLDTIYQKNIDTNYTQLKFFNLNSFQRSNFQNPVTILNKNRNPEGYEQSNLIDSIGSNITTYDQIDSNQISYSLTLPLDDYLLLRKKQINNEIWDSILTRHDLAQALSQGDISKMIASATGISIPIPQTALMSIFGKPELSLSVNGEINLRVGWRFDTQNLGTVSGIWSKSIESYFQSGYPSKCKC